MKKKIYRIFFFISFLPVVALLSYAIYSSVVGIEGFAIFEPGEMVYRFEAFQYVLMMLLVFVPYIRILLFVCLSYQVAYLYTRKNDNKKPVIITTIAATAIGIFVLIGYYIKALGMFGKF